MNKHLLLLAILAALFTGVDAADDAQRIVDEAQRRATTKSERYEGLLESFNASGKNTSEKRWIFQRLGAHGQSKSIIRFTAPAEVRGVALLIVNRPDRASDQWMWTPALERDRRIALQDRSTKFFGTDFSFEDLEEREAGQYEHELLGEEQMGGAAAWKIQAVPKASRSSQYTKQIVWIRKDNYAIVRIDSYVKEQVVRRLEFADFRQVGGTWTAHDTGMIDQQRKTRTRLRLDKVEYNLPLKDDDFTLQALRRQQ
jgi:outer membrane lipoprotein-sorting protein